MTQILYGNRLGREGKIRVGCSAAIFDEIGRILLTRRADNGQWCLPIGGMEPGKSPSEAAVCEVFEETGLHWFMLTIQKSRSLPSISRPKSPAGH